MKARMTMTTIPVRTGQVRLLPVQLFTAIIYVQLCTSGPSTSQPEAKKPRYREISVDVQPGKAGFRRVPVDDNEPELDIQLRDGRRNAPKKMKPKRQLAVMSAPRKKPLGVKSAGTATAHVFNTRDITLPGQSAQSDHAQVEGLVEDETIDLFEEQIEVG